MADFEKGTLTKVSVSSDGRLMLAPALTEVLDPSVTFLWAIARDSKGNVYTGGGGVGSSKAKLFQIDPTGKSKTLAEIDGMAIQAIAIDRQDRVYAATSPEGKVYRVDSAGKVEVFYDPKATYIWALAFSSSGDLFVATGDQGEIHKVTPTGSGSVFFKTEETHARSLAIDAQGNLIVGTDPSGLVLRITPAGEGFVLYQGAKREVTSVAVAPDGTIYAAAVGNRQAASLPALPAQNPNPAQGQNPVPLPLAARPTPIQPQVLALSLAGGSEVYKIQTDGYPRKIWSHPQDLVYALAFDARGRLIIGGGNRGAVYRLDSDSMYTLLLKLESTQVTGFSAAPGGRLYAVTGNIGKVFSIGPESAASGTFESDVFDTGGFSYWGRLHHEFQAADSIGFETRSGNVNRAQKDWSPWAKIDAGRIASPAARFVQYRATLSGAAELTNVEIAYQAKNVPPVIDQLEITAANYKFPAPVAAPAASNATLTLPPLGRKNNATEGGGSDSGSTPPLAFAKGHIGSRWLASDDDGDTLVFKVEIRGQGETTWKLLKDKIRERYFSWDSTAFPDGKYVLRITASDAPSNPPGEELSTSRTTDPFLIDNTPPEITGLSSSVAGGKIEVRFHAKDASSTLSKAEYSVNGGDWLRVDPTTRLTDSMEHDYRISIERGQGEVTVAVRIEDEYSNESVAKTVVK